MDKSARFARTHPLASLDKDKHLFLPTPTSLQKDFSFRRLGTVGANVIINVTRGRALGVKKKKKKENTVWIYSSFLSHSCHKNVTQLSHSDLNPFLRKEILKIKNLNLVRNIILQIFAGLEIILWKNRSF